MTHVSDNASSLVKMAVGALGSRTPILATYDSAMQVADVWGQCLAEGIMSSLDVELAIAEALRTGYPMRDAHLVQHRAFARARQIGPKSALFH